MTMVTALALADAVDSLCGAKPALKWPNDLLFDGRKVAGILAESVLGPAPAVVVGVGCNVHWKAMPPALVEIATSLDLVCDRRVEREDLLVRMLENLEVELGHVSGVVERYRHRLATVGRRVRVELAGTTVVGIAVGIADDGALLVRADDGSDHTIAAGDVVHLRAAETDPAPG
jgi:BirA family biotin operon repressor/biotin-[acetyl-CoA-carboxylase] ligase